MKNMLGEVMRAAARLRSRIAVCTSDLATQGAEGLTEAPEAGLREAWPGQPPKLKPFGRDWVVLALPRSGFVP